jgi:hypothetical protein
MTDSAVGIERAPTRLQIPFLITCGMAFMAFFAAVAAVALVFFLVLILFSSGPFTIDGAPVTKGAFLSVALPIFLVIVPVAALAGAFAWGVWKEHAWTREAAMAFWACSVLVSIGQLIVVPDQRSEALQGLFSVFIIVPLALWYFYRKRSVVLYYRELKDRQRGA